MAGQHDEWTDTDGVAEHIGVPPKTIVTWRYLRSGPPYVKVGKHVRYRWADVDAWLAQQYVRPA